MSDSPATSPHAVENPAAGPSNASAVGPGQATKSDKAKRRPIFTARDIFLGLFPNVVAAAVFWFFGADFTRQHDLETARLQEQTAVVQNLLETASKMMVAARVDPSRRGLTPAQRIELKDLDSQFEVTYWGRWALIQDPTAEHCLTQLKIKLSNISNGIGNLKGRQDDLLGLQTLIDATAQDLGRLYNPANRLWLMQRNRRLDVGSHCDRLEPAAGPSEGSPTG
jgi:hypothetical protein